MGEGRRVGTVGREYVKVMLALGRETVSGIEANGVRIGRAGQAVGIEVEGE